MKRGISSISQVIIQYHFQKVD